MLMLISTFSITSTEMIREKTIRLEQSPTINLTVILTQLPVCIFLPYVKSGIFVISNSNQWIYSLVWWKSAVYFMILWFTFSANLTRNGSDNFCSFSYEFERDGESKTVFAFSDTYDRYTIVTVDWIQNGMSKFQITKML